MLVWEAEISLGRSFGHLWLAVVLDAKRTRNTVLLFSLIVLLLPLIVLLLFSHVFSLNILQTIQKL